MAESNTRRIVFVVGDRFTSFGSQTGVITVSKLFDALNGLGDAYILPDVHYIPAQGLSNATIRAVAGLAEARQLGPWFSTWEARAGRPKAGRALSHKAQLQNVLVSVPRRLADHCFEVDMDIDDKNELMLDHVTGKHVQGMVLIEACRQTFLSVTQKFYLAGKEDEKYYFVIDSIEVKYLAFVFPIEAQIVYTILDSNLVNPAKMSFKSHMAIVQNGVTVTEMTVEFTAFSHSLISRKEGRLAQQSVANAMASTLRGLVDSSRTHKRRSTADFV